MFLILGNLNKRKKKSQILNIEFGLLLVHALALLAFIINGI
jgi:hypothetical protein